MALSSSSDSRTSSKVSSIARCLPVLAAAQIGTSCDNATLSNAASVLVGSLGATVADVQLATMVYSLAAGAFMIAGGMVGVMIGWKRNIRLGLVLAIIGEIAVAASPNMVVFTWVGRTLVGLGASFITPSVLGMVPALWGRGRDRVFAFGCISAAIALSTIVSIPFGFLLDSFGFRATFVVFACYFCVVLVSTIVLPEAGRASRKLSFDFTGFALAGAGLLLFLLGVSKMSTWGPIGAFPAAPFSLLGVSPALVCLFAGLILLIVLVIVEKRIESRRGFALLPQAFVGNAAVLSGLLAVMLPYFFMGSLMIVMTPFIQLVAGLTAFQTSLLMLLPGVPMLIFAMLFPRVFPHVTPRATIRLGYVATAAGALLMAIGFEEAGVNPCFYAGLVMAGAGMGTVNSQANNAVASSVSRRDAEQSGGIQGAARNVGMALGSAVLGTVLLVFVGSSLPASIAATEAVSPDVRTALEQSELSFMGDDALLNLVGELPVTVSENETEAIMETNAHVRLNAERWAMGLLAVVCLAGLLGTRRLLHGSASAENDLVGSTEGLHGIEALEEPAAVCRG